MDIESDVFDFGDNLELLAGFHFGLTGDFPISQNVSFEPGVLLSRKGYKLDITSDDPVDEFSVKWTSRLDYLVFPMRVKGRIDKDKVHLYAAAGPYAAVGVGGFTKGEIKDKNSTEKFRYDIDWGNDEDEDDYRRMDYGVTSAIGLGINDLQFEVFYEYGISNLVPYDSGNTKYKNRAFGASASFMF